MSRLSRVWPQPVGLTIGGRLVMVAEYRLADLATLQTWLETQAPHPLAKIPPAEDDADPDTRPERLRDAMKALADWPPRIGSIAATMLLASMEGRLMQLFVSMARAKPETSIDDAISVLADTTPADFRSVRRVAWGVAAWREIVSELAPDTEDADPMDWGKELFRLAEAFHWTPDQVGDLTIGQWRLLASGGSADEYQGRPRSGESMWDAIQRDAKIFGYDPNQKGTEPGA
jgi:hypothetical protein